MVNEDIAEGTGDLSGDTGVDAEAPEQEIAAETAESTIAETEPAGDSAETAQPSVHDLLAALPDDELESVLSHERLKFRVNQREDAARQRERERIARESASSEQAAAILDDILLRARDADDLGEIKKLSATVVQRNQAYEAMELARNVPDALLRNHPVPVEVREQAVEARERGDWDGYVGTLLNGAVEAEIKKLRAGDEQKIASEVARKLAAEIKARGIEKAPVRETPPAAPGGGAPGPGITPAQLEAMPTSVFMAKPPEERQRLIEESHRNAAAAARR